ncbi:MAG: succinyl-diaminopimelate desuccinylase [Rhodobacteraceae bacterium]|nr:MAG: succinyl-diaminopimelate desuccinylase [Paracoccaceae bacterium]
MIDVVELTAKLIQCPTVTPREAGALKLIGKLFENTDFKIHSIDRGGISNLFLRWGEKNLPTLGFSGHIDVVPPGNLAKWEYEPFSGKIVGNVLFGRGAVDMKSAVAAFCLAAIKYSKKSQPDFSIALMITGDEEGEAKDGTQAILDWMTDNDQRIDHCIVGEPTCPKTFGEVMKIGRKGSMTCTFKITGKQGHSAYPHLAINPINAAMELLNHLIRTELDNGSKFFEPSTLVITSISANNNTNNVIPSEVTTSINIRFNDNHTSDQLTQKIKKLSQEISNKTKTHVDLDFRVSGEPFYTEPTNLAKLVKQSVKKITGVEPAFSTSGGTSDARFIYKKCPVVEFGLVGEKMHSINESVEISQIFELEEIYLDLINEHARHFKNSF